MPKINVSNGFNVSIVSVEPHGSCLGCGPQRAKTPMDSMDPFFMGWNLRVTPQAFRKVAVAGGMSPTDPLKTLNPGSAQPHPAYGSNVFKGSNVSKGLYVSIVSVDA